MYRIVFIFVVVVVVVVVIVVAAIAQQNMQSASGVMPSLVCYNAALHGMAGAGEGKRARDLVETMQRGPRATR